MQNWINIPGFKEFIEQESKKVSTALDEKAENVIDALMEGARKETLTIAQMWLLKRGGGKLDSFENDANEISEYLFEHAVNNLSTKFII